MAKGRESGMPDEAYWESFFDAECILSKLHCCGDGDVVEFGCGYGTFTLPAARRSKGMVYALDIDREMVSRTAELASASGVANVSAELRDFVSDGSGRPDASASYAMLFNILHIEDPVGLLREAHRALRPGGHAGVIHWRHDRKTPRGPSMEIRPTPDQCREWAEQAGFRFVSYDELSCCSWHWGMTLERA